MNDDIPETPLDQHFAALMQRLHGEPHRELELAARTVSAWRAAGHICVPVEEIGGDAIANSLRATSVVGSPGEAKPLILDDHGRLYLQRYWQYESRLATAIRSRVGAQAECDEPLLQSDLAGFFKSSPAAKSDRQRTAAETAVRQTLTVITGGPGTGKTWTVVVVLALLHAQFRAAGRTLRAALAAPTGKAAARMKESIQRTLEGDAALRNFRDALSADATTLHRLLGFIPDSPYFRHDADRPLTADVVIVDEASMIDLALMAKLFDAVRPEARIVLLGDKDQLASVEAGNVLGDICNATGGDDTTASPLSKHIVELRTSHRFREDSGIHHLSIAVNSGDADAAIALLADGKHRDISAKPLPPPMALAAALREQVISGFRGCLEAHDPGEALNRLAGFRILCAVRRGSHGVENFNQLAEEMLASEGLILPASAHYRGRPVMVMTNDYQLGLFNGDTGLILPDEDADGELRAWFPDASGTPRRFLPARLPEHETVFAMTVHKSQGSEFSRVLLVLPKHDTQLLTRELIYTGITRARESVELWHDEQILRAAITRRTVRTSGLRDALWSNGGL